MICYSSRGQNCQMKCVSLYLSPLWRKSKYWILYLFMIIWPSINRLFIGSCGCPWSAAAAPAFWFDNALQHVAFSHCHFFWDWSHTLQRYAPAPKQKVDLCKEILRFWCCDKPMQPDANVSDGICVFHGDKVLLLHWNTTDSTSTQHFCCLK